MGDLLSKPWRVMPTSYEEDEEFVKSYHPRNGQTKHLRILLHGPVGAGKSSFIDSVDSILQKRVTQRALTDSISGNSFTRKYRTFRIEKEPGSFYSFIFNDMGGFAPSDDGGVNVEDVKLALRGHVRDGYEFIPDRPLKEEDEAYNPSPTLEDRAHVLVSVIPTDKAEFASEQVMEKMREVRLAASNMGIPQLAILTKVDKACPEVKDNIKNTYKSKYLKKKVETFSEVLGLPINCIFLVKNYSSEVSMDDDMNVLIMSALRQMITHGEDFLNDL